MVVLFQFLLRLACGLAVGMALTSSRQVASGYFRNHLYVTLGLTTLATLVGYSAGLSWQPALVAALVSYVGTVCWLYELPRAGSWALWLVAGGSLLGAWQSPVGSVAVAAAPADPVTIVESQASESRHTADALAPIQRGLTTLTSALVLGVIMAAMLLGHWYLNSPGMELAPLQRLLLVAGAAIMVHAALCAWGFLGNAASAAPHSTLSWLLLLFLRWAFGMTGVVVLLWMAAQTLRIPNTQSATGILYVAVIASFAGELMGLLLSAGLPYAL